MMRQRGWKSCTVLCLSSGGQEKHAVTGTTFIPPHRHRVCHEVWMWVEKEWQTRRDGRGEACVSPLGPPPSCYIHSLFLTVLPKNLCVCVFVTRYSHKRFCILSTLFIPPFHLNGSIFRWSFTVLPGFVLLWDEMRRLTGYGSVQNCKHTQVYVFPQKWDSLFCLHSVQLVPLSCSIKACKCFWKCVIIKVELIGDILFSSNYSRADMVHNAWHLCLLHLSSSPLQWKTSLSSSFVYCCRPRISMEGSILLLSLCRNWSQLRVHACNRDRKQTDWLMLSLTVIFGCNSAHFSGKTT